MAKIRYAAVVGKPIPRIIATIIVISNAKIGIPKDQVKISAEIFDPKPVIPRVPAIIPAAAQAIAIGTIFFVPSTIALWLLVKNLTEIFLFQRIFKIKI